MVLAPGAPARRRDRPDRLAGREHRRRQHRHPAVVARHLRHRRAARPRPCAGTASSPRQKSELERQAEGHDKTGVFTGAFARNPVNDRRDPDLHRRLRADGVRHRGDHGGARRRTSATGRSPRSSTCRSSAPCSRPSGFDGDAYLGDGPAINSGFLDGLDVDEAKARDHRVARGGGHRRADRHVQAARLAVQPPALLGRAVPDRLRRARRPARGARRRAAGRAARARRLPSRSRTTADDADSEPEPPLARAERVARGRARPR